MSLVQKQAGASEGRKFGAHTASKRPSLAGIDMMQLFFKAGELEKRPNRGFWQKRHFETLNSYLCYWKSSAKAEMCGASIRLQRRRDVRWQSPTTMCAGKGCRIRLGRRPRAPPSILPCARIRAIDFGAHNNGNTNCSQLLQSFPVFKGPCCFQ